MERVGFFFLVKWFDRVMSVVQASAIHVFLNRKITREKQKTKPKKIKKKNKLTRQDQINLANKNESQGKLSWRKDVKTRESQR